GRARRSDIWQQIAPGCIAYIVLELDTIRLVGDRTPSDRDLIVCARDGLNDRAGDDTHIKRFAIAQSRGSIVGYLHRDGVGRVDERVVWHPSECPSRRIDACAQWRTAPKAESQRICREIGIGGRVGHNQRDAGMDGAVSNWAEHRRAVDFVYENLER